MLLFIKKNYKKNGALSTKIHSLSKKKNENYNICGPKGLGLQLKNDSTGTYIAFVGGTGILPFMDLFDLLFKKVVMIASKNPLIDI